MDVRVQPTPNPNARRFLLDRPVQAEPRGRSFKDPATAADPLAARLLSVDGVAAVMLLPGSVTVTKEPAATWEEVEPRIRETLEEHFT
jgi:hypothetical protein